jgi:hypothetical protein
LKNSWGQKWGDKGYIKVRAQENGDGICGMQTWVSFVKTTKNFAF